MIYIIPIIAIILAFIIVGEPKIDKNIETGTYLIWYTNLNKSRTCIDTKIKIWINNNG